MKILITLIMLLFVSFRLFSGIAYGMEEKLKEAISLANQEKYRESITILKSLSIEHPQDHRIFLSLGLVYRSIGNIDNAIIAFERAVLIKPSEDGYYSLGLLYEAMALPDNNPTGNPKIWLKKALTAWNKFIGLNPPDTRRIEVAHRHIRQIKPQINQ